MPNINEMLINDADENNALNMLRGVIAQQRAISPIVSTSFDSGNLPNEFISPSTPDGSVEPTGADFIGTFMSGQGREFTVNGVTKNINIGGVNLGVLQFGGAQDDGVFYAGGGVVTLDADGINILAESGGTFANLNAYTFTDGQDEIIGGTFGTGAVFPSVNPSHEILLSSAQVTGEDSLTTVQSYAPDTNQSIAKMTARTTSDENYIKIETGTTDKITLDLLSGQTGMEIIGGAGQQVNVILGGDDQLIFDNNAATITFDNYVLVGKTRVYLDLNQNTAGDDGYLFRDSRNAEIGGVYFNEAYIGNAEHEIDLYANQVTGESSTIEVRADGDISSIISIYAASYGTNKDGEVRMQGSSSKGYARVQVVSTTDYAISSSYNWIRLLFSPDVAKYFVFLDSGRMGINALPTTYELEIAGSENITGNYYINGVAITAGGATFDKIQFDTTETGPTAEGMIAWDTDEGTLSIGMPGGNVHQQVGMEMYIPRRVKKATAGNVLNGQLVYINGGSGVNLTVELAQGNAELTSAHVIAMATEDFSNTGSGGWCTTFGLVRGTDTQPIDTNAYTPGTVLYLSPTTAGAFTSTKPSSPNHMVVIGVCYRQHSTLGAILVNIQNGFELEELHNVAISGLADDDLLQYDSASQTWKNAPIATAITGFVSTSPSTAAQNTIQPSADVVNLTIKQKSGGTKNLTEWRNSSGGNLAYITPTFGAYFSGNVGIGTTPGSIRLVAADATSIGTPALTVAPTMYVDAGTNYYASEYRGSGLYTGFYVTNSLASGAPFLAFGKTDTTTKFWTLQMESNRAFSLRDGNAADTQVIYVKPGGNVGFGSTNPLAKHHIAAVADSIQQIVQGYSSQTAALTQWMNSSSAVLAQINAAGSLSAQGLTLAYVAKTGNYTVGADDYTVEATSGTFTLTLPTAVGVVGKIYQIKSTSTGLITLATTSSQTIDGALTQTLSQYENLTVQSNGANWILIH